MKVYIVNPDDLTIEVESYDNVANEESLWNELYEIFGEDVYDNVRDANYALLEYLKQIEENTDGRTDTRIQQAWN